MGAVDVAGSGVVHVMGGASALAGAYIAGPRLTRPPDDSRSLSSIRRNSQHCLSHLRGTPTSSWTLLCLGAFLMAFSFVGFNLGSLQRIIGNGRAAGRVLAVTTISGMSGTLAAAAAGLALRWGDFSVATLCNGGPLLTCATVSIHMSLTRWRYVMYRPAGSCRRQILSIHLFANKQAELVTLLQGPKATVVSPCLQLMRSPRALLENMYTCVRFHCERWRLLR
jgi:hypothetical protein